MGKKITKDDLKEHSMNDMLTKSYGKKGTLKRKASEKRINAKAKNLVKDNKKKEAEEKKWKTIKAPVGSIIVVPKEIQALKKHGIDLKASVRKVQKEMYGRVSNKW